MDNKQNLRIGAAGNRRFTFMFRATQTSTLDGFRLQWRTGPGYSGTAGNYGRIRVSVRADDGSGKPSSKSLATVDVDPTTFDEIAFDDRLIRTTTFTSGAPITAGNRYHLHMENVHANLKTSYISINTAFVFSHTVKILGRNCPHFANEDFATLESKNGGPWTVLERCTPMVDLIYANNTHDGFAYQGVVSAPPSAMPKIGGAKMVRERFTVKDGDKKVTKLWARVGRISGSDEIVLRLENADGSLIAGGPAPGSGAIPTIVAGAKTGSKGTWVSFTLTQPRILTSGKTYSLRISAPASTTYQHACMLSEDSGGLKGKHDMKSYAFREGRGEVSTDGGNSWGPCYGAWYHNSTQTAMELAP